MNRGWIITGLVNKFTGNFHPKHVCEELLCSVCHMAIHTRICIFIQPVCCVQTIIAYKIYIYLWFWLISFLKKMVWRLISHFIKPFVSNQIKSNHFYCHITTAQVPWWVKFLWACSRQCRKTTDNLPMDRQCKKNNKQFTYGQTVQKNNKQFTYGQTVQKKQQTIYIWTDSAKKTTNNLHMDRQCKKTALEHLQCSRQCKKTTTTAIYIWTDSAKKLQQFTYGQYIFTDCTEDNVQNTHTYTQYA